MSHQATFLAAATLMLMLGATVASAAQQLPKDPEERAKAIALIMQTNARQLTLFDREGKELSAVGSRDLYQQPVFSPDAKRVAVIKVDLDKESNDLWVVDVPTGKTTRISVSGERESATAPAWAPDGNHVAYVAFRQGAYWLYQKPSNGEGTEELLFKSNAPLVLTDWSMDGRYITFYSTDLGGGTIYALPLAGSGERKAIEILRSKSQLTGPRLSPDDRFVAYVSNETGRTELYVRPFNPSASGAAPSTEVWKLSEQGAQGMAFWRRDGKEISFLAPDRSIQSVSLSTSPDFEFTKPKVLFRLPETTPVAPNMASVNRDADRYVVAVPPPQLRQLTFVDREGKPVGTVGPPGRYASEQVFRYTPGAFIGLTDWSPDAKFMTFTTGVLLMVPVQSQEKALDRKAFEWLREDYEAADGRFSPDGRFLAFLSNEIDVRTMQAYVRPFNSAKPNTPAGPAVQVTNIKTGIIAVRWRRDGKELFILTRDREIMAVDVTSTTPFKAGTPGLLFKVTDPLVGMGDVSPDGQRFVVAMPVR